MLIAPVLTRQHYIQLILIFNGSMNCWFHQNQCFHRVESILFPRWGLTGDFKNWSWKTFFCNLRKSFQSFWGRLILFLDAHQILVFHWGTCQVVFEIFSVWCYWIRREEERVGGVAKTIPWCFFVRIWIKAHLLMKYPFSKVLISILYFLVRLHFQLLKTYYRYIINGKFSIWG